MKTLTFIDRVIDQLDQTLRTFAQPASDAAYPDSVPKSTEPLKDTDRREVARLMRVNHAGEMAAQALYHGHALCAASTAVHENMRSAARDELAHLRWTGARVRELGSHRSYLTPFWYLGSWMIGAGTGLMGDRWSLGFVAETERQVVAHLLTHLQRLPSGDHRSRAILEQMIIDEGRHATQAVEAGGARLGWLARSAMRAAAKVMTTTAYWL
ncbi:MAG: 2-polyprenyl-3-methyl-6-methoxy-1,4-benzoquinone monooxygenase [Gammaproteobacteria bacterium]|nr:2-polyprenyl-3-methyl-6-methoxy-1,4-benzoquinone monooxygenase [Gammaproteobacteria bacterium]